LVCCLSNFCDSILGELESCRYFVASLYQQLLGKPSPVPTSSEAHLELFHLHLALTRPRDQLTGPLTGLLSLQQVAARLELSLTEGSLCLALAATRLRLTWPAHCRAELTAVWDQVSNAARRHLVPSRLVGLLQLVHMVSHVATVLPDDGRPEKLCSGNWNGSGTGAVGWSSPPRKNVLENSVLGW
jgi:hypothetical protein